MISKKYMEMLYVFSRALRGRQKLVIEWHNGLKVRCDSPTGIMETDTEPGDEDYIGEYDAFVENAEVLHPGSDDSIQIFQDNRIIDINIFSIPDRIESEDGTLLWKREYPFEEYVKQDAACAACD